ncbi:Uncharacterised protein [Shigella sonnei]|nr:Uncharacterised protein [Shigella sonnei]CSH49482.1 Uncharacterised protein [Shigella sonnei]
MLPLQLSVLGLRQSRQVQLGLALAAHPAWQRLPVQVVQDAYVQRTLLQTAAPSLLHAASAACSLRSAFLPLCARATRGSAGFPSDRLAQSRSEHRPDAFQSHSPQNVFHSADKKRLAQEQWRELPGCSLSALLLRSNAE